MLVRKKFDLLVVDEAHRLRRRLNLTNYKSFDDGCKRLGLDNHSCSELDWIKMQSNQAILFYDEGQSIKPTDAPKTQFDSLKSEKQSLLLKLKSQFRVRGGNAYVDYIETLLKNTLEKDQVQFEFKNYEFLLFDSIDEIVEQIKKRDAESGLSRIIAGFSWKMDFKKNIKFKRH